MSAPGVAVAQPQDDSRRVTRRWRSMVTEPKVLAALSIFAVWWFGAIILPPDIVPVPTDVARAIAKLATSSEGWFHLGQTVWRIVVGFVISAVLGISVGLIMGVGRRVASFLELWITFIITIPSLCWAIIALAWFGLRNTAAFFTIVSITFPLIAVNFWSGVKNIDMSLIEMARVFRAGRRLTIRRVVIPQLVPYAIAAARYGLPMAWKMAIIAEMLGLSNGVGYQLVYHFHVLDMTAVFAWMLMFTSVMIFVEYLVIQPIERFALRWRPAVGY